MSGRTLSAPSPSLGAPSVGASAGAEDSVATLVQGRRRRARSRDLRTGLLALLVVGVFLTSLMVGNTFYGLGEVADVVLGRPAGGAAFTVGELRLPRATAALLAGLAFGLAGATFQTLLRNPLASPDVIGISSGASAGAVVGIVVLGWSEAGVSLLALVGAVATAGLIYALAHRQGFSGIRLILIGIGVGAVLDSIVTYVLSRAASWDLQAAMQWLTGSLNGASWGRILPLAVCSAVVVPLMVAFGGELGVLRLGEDSATALGVRVTPVRVVLVTGAVTLLAVATSVTGPIAFLALMSGPIAARLTGPGGSVLLPAGLVGALLVLVGDLGGQFAFDSRYPVGVITGVVGAMYLVFLLVRTNRMGGSL